MAGVVTASVRKGGSGCDHRTVTVTLDGTSFALQTGEADLDAMPWDDAARRQFVLLGLRRLRALGLALDDAPGRVTNGDEGSNVRQFALLSKDQAKTNIGTAYVNILPALIGERTLIDFTGCTQFRAFANVNQVGTGQLQFRVIRDADSVVIYESSPVSGAGEKEIDTGWQPLPAAAAGEILVRVQGKSTVGADDPVFRRFILLVK